MEIGEFAQADRCLDEAVEAADALGDAALEADAVLTRLLVAHHTADDLDAWRADVQRETDRLIPLLEQEDAPRGAREGVAHGRLRSRHRLPVAGDRGRARARHRLRPGGRDARQVARLFGLVRDGAQRGPDSGARGDRARRGGSASRSRRPSGRGAVRSSRSPRSTRCRATSAARAS